jgi:amidohydrolase
MKVHVLNHTVETCRDQLIAWRRRFHEYPELQLECHRTAAVVAEHLKHIGLDIRTGIAKTGVVGVIRGRRTNPVVALRVDMDGLPVPEQTGLPFASKVEGVMHACGHDGHTAMGLGVATVLGAVRDDLQGTVKLIFQPGEESPGGSKIMIAEGALEEPGVDAIFGCHISPQIAFGEVGIRYGTMTAANDEFTIRIKGVGGHAARPHHCTDPIVAASNLIIGVQSIVSRLNNPLKPLVISICEIKGGSGHNVIPEGVTLKGTIRSVDEETRALAWRNLDKIVKGIELGHGVEAGLEIQPCEPPLRCDKRLVAFVEETLRELMDPDRVQSIPEPSMGAEDFAFYSERIPAAYVRLGCYDADKGYVHGLHSPYFDFDENLLAEGTRILSYLLMRFVSSDLRL